MDRRSFLVRLLALLPVVLVPLGASLDRRARVAFRHSAVMRVRYVVVRVAADSPRSAGEACPPR